MEPLIFLVDVYFFCEFILSIDILADEKIKMDFPDSYFIGSKQTSVDLLVLEYLFLSDSPFQSTHR